MKKGFRQFLDKIGHYNKLVDEYKRAVGTSPDHSMAYVNWGIDLAQEGQMDEALLKFEKATEIAPNRFEPYLNWGVALAKMNRLDEAIEKFKLAIQKDSKAVNPYILWGAALMEQGKPEEAKEKYDRAIALNPENPEPYVNCSIAMARTGQYKEAIKNLKQALAIHGYQPQLYFLWGVILAELRDYETAIEKFQITLRFVPKHPEAYYFWSVALNRLGRYEEALEKSKKALGLEQEKPEIYLNQGDILANLNRLDVAISNYRHAITLDPDLPEAYMSWGVALCRLGQYEEGYTKLAKSLELDPELVGVQQQWGHFLLEQKQYADALAHLRIATEQEPENLDNLLNLSMALIKTGHQDEAIDLLFEIEKKDRWNPQAHYLLGTHFMGAGNLTKAQEHLSKALEEKPDFEDASVNMALVLCEMGETLEAVRRMRPVIRRNPDSARNNFFYGVILFRHGDYKDALVKYEKALSLEPDYLEAQIGLAEVQLRLSRQEEAEEGLRHILSQRPDSIPSLYLLGLCLIRKAETLPEAEHQALYQEALQLMEKAAALDPSHLDAQANRAFLLGRLDSLTAMNNAFEQLLQVHPEAIHPMILYYWSQALTQSGHSEAAEAKLAEARRANPDIETQMQSISI